MKKEYIEIKTEWEDVTEPQYNIFIECPNKDCKKELEYTDIRDSEGRFAIDECDKVNKLVYCKYCGFKFKLKIPAYH